MHSGTYEVDHPLLVPDGVSLEGEGVMLFDDRDLPVEFQPGTETTITADSGLRGNLVTLGDGSSVRRLVLKGATEALEDDAGRGGNVVAVASRRRDDSVSAAIDECELIDQIMSGAGTDGPTGGALLAYTRNPKRGADPPPHENAAVTVQMTRSRVSTPIGGQAVFAMNFAARGKVNAELAHNVLGGPLDVIGGLSRPDEVVNATTAISSSGNLYSQPGNEGPAWQITGGSPPPFPGSGSSSNSANAQSKDDRIDGFQFGIIALGGRRFSTAGGTCSSNEVKLELHHLTLHTEGPDAADFVFAGALSGGLFSAGDDNTVRVHVEQTTGSGHRRNLYADSADFGTGNQLAFVGTHTAFIHSNHAIDPAPPAEFFH